MPFLDEDGNVDLFDKEVIPEGYLKFDRNGTLEKLLDALSESLQGTYDKLEVLKDIQDPKETPREFLKYMAESWGWELKAQDEQAQRVEVRNIVDYYRLKGTEKGIEIIAVPLLEKYFNSIDPVMDYDFSWQMTGNHFYFDGQQGFLGVPHDDTLNVQPPFKIRMWINAEIAKQSWILGKGRLDKESGYVFTLEPAPPDSDSSKPVLNFKLNEEAKDYTVDARISTNVWRKVEIIVTDKIELFVNNDLEDVTEAPEEVYYEDEDLWIGSRGGSSEMYQGYMDEIKIYDDLEEKQANLAGHWKLDKKVSEI